MLQMTLTAPETITKGEAPIPEPLAGEVVLKIVSSGICGSDIHAYYDKHPFVSLPIVTGHEFSGTIAAIGEGVEGFTVGDRVTVMPQVYCDDCLNCRAGRYNICSTLQVIGCQVTGASQEMLAVDARLVLRLPDDMSFDVGAMLEPIAVGIHACKRATGGEVKGKKVIVQGAGTIGNLAAQAAKALGAESVMITDMITPRLEVAKTCGIDHVVNIMEQDLAKEIESLWGANGADVIIECVGLQAAIDQAIKIGRKGSDIIVAGVYGDYATVNMGLVQDKELNLIGTLMYTKEDWLDAIKLVSDKSIVPEPLISAHFPLSDLHEAFRYIEANKNTALKVLIQA